MSLQGFSFAAALADNAKSQPPIQKQNTQSANATSSVSLKSGFSFSSALNDQAKVRNDESAPKSFNDAQSLLDAKAWQAGNVTLTCIEKWSETHDVTSFRFQGITPVKFNFKPGQFISFKLNIDGKPCYRSYTISSSPSRPYSLVVTIKQIPNGLFSNAFVNQINVGEQVEVSGPFGAFNLVDIKAEKYLFLSAGSGITPMHSMSRWLSDTTVDSDIAFVHSARSAKDVIFSQSTANMANQRQGFTLGYILEEVANSNALNQLHQNTLVSEGRFSIEKLQQMVPDYQSRTAFICGPEPYMQAVKQMLIDAGFDMARFYQESFEAPSLIDDDSISDAASFAVAIDGKSFNVNANESLLQGMERESLPIIAACRSGVCGSCKCKVVSGETRSTTTGPLTPTEIDDGYVLACSSFATSDVKLEV